MLNPQQLAQLKTSSGGGNTGVSPTQAMTPEQAHTWISGTPAPAAASNPINSIGDAFNSGVGQMKAGYEDASSATNPLTKTEAGVKMLAGGVNTALSPLAPVMKPVGDAINATGNALSDKPLIKGAAGNTTIGSHGETNYTPNMESNRVTEDINNAATVLPFAAGALSPSEVGSEMSGVAKTVKDTAGSIKDRLTPEPPPPGAAQAKTVAQTVKAQQAVQDSVRQTANKYVKSSGVLHEAESVNGTKPLEVISSYPKGKALPSIEGGKVNPDEAIDYLKGKIGELSNIKNDAVFLNDNKVPVEDFGKYAHDLVDAQKGWSNVRKSDAHAQLDTQLRSIDAAYKTDLPLSEIDKIKTEQTGLSKSYNNNGAKPFELDTHGILGKAARDLVEMHTEDAPTKELNKLIQSHYDAVDLLDSMRGKAPHGGQLARYAGRIGGEITGAIAGSTVGHPFIGALTGRIGADMLDSVLHSNFISNPLKRMMIDKMEGVEPAVRQKMLQYIEQNSPDIGELGERPTQSPYAGK